MNDSLRTLLEAHCLFRPALGYVQGMSYLAGVGVGHVGDGGVRVNSKACFSSLGPVFLTLVSSVFNGVIFFLRARSIIRLVHICLPTCLCICLCICVVCVLCGLWFVWFMLRLV